MKNFRVIKKLENAIEELDDNKVSWIDKHLVIDLHDKAVVFLHSVNTLTDKDEAVALKGAELFLKEVEPVITKLNEKEEK